ncbi:hypothetical protein PR001_g32004 [Phytophthora rubi]|uniref:Uncharacterized protein n=1 Tax=Phytophthora rubi TaxID=129364 RepID=A0A6A3GGW1_9STRA|nr:hypothetical protein PR001_g32004 [Phytophthora rubi]
MDGAAGFGWCAEVDGGVQGILQGCPAASGGEDGGGAEAKEAKLPLPWSSGGEVGVGVRAKEAKLRLQGCTPVSVVTSRVDLELLIEQCTTFS